MFRKLKQNNAKAFNYLMLFMVVVLIYISGNIFLENYHYGEGYHRKLQKNLLGKFVEMDKVFATLKENNWKLDTRLSTDNGITIIAYNNDSLIYWSDNNVKFASFTNQTSTGKRFILLSNGWYVAKEYKSDSIRAYALYLIKAQYPYENDFLVNEYHSDLKLPKSTVILPAPETGAFSIHDWEGIYLFSIQFDKDELRFAGIKNSLLPVLFFVALLLAILFVNNFLRNLKPGKIKNGLIIFLAIFFVIFRVIQCRFHFPSDIYDFELFSPTLFAYSSWMPSLGDVFINSILLLYFGLILNRDFKISKSHISNDHLRSNYLLIAGLLSVFVIFFIYTHYTLSNLILHSTISFEIFKITGLSIFTFVGLLIMAIHFLLLIILADKFLVKCREVCSLKRLIIAFFSILIFWFLVGRLFIYRIDLFAFFAIFIIFTVIAALHYRNLPLYNYAQLTVMIILFSVFSVVFITYYVSIKTHNNMELLAENLAEQHDPVAEYLLQGISKRLEEDDTLYRYISDRNVSYEEIFNHLQINYFNGFWGKYNLTIVECLPGDSLIVPPVQLKYNCYDYYDDLIDNGGVQLPGTNFYYLEIQNGRINYLGRVEYMNPNESTQMKLFIELESRLMAEELGYPELLLESKYHESKIFEEYSYAKYHRGQLLARSGTFNYRLNLSTYSDLDDNFEGYDHYIYNSNDENVIIISRSETTFFDILVSLSYIFLFYYSLFLLFSGIRQFSKQAVGIELNFKNKIRLSVISILLLSLIFVGGGSVYFSMEQYRQKQNEILSEKIQSVYIELDHILAQMKNLSSDWRGSGYENLNHLLIRFSDVFYSDINLYDPFGQLLATSRAEIFIQGIIGERMEPLAYNALVLQKQAELIQRENIGNLSFLSAYVPLFNLENNLLAYINLPYFTRANVLQNEITNLIVAVANIYVLLILLTFIFTVFISNQIVIPLRMIQKRFSEIKLGKKNDEIVYDGRDEIAGLVDEYNRMVKELAKSVEMLSKSERESAWREMAKQIAHEIKNPLTPMKLSVQHLQRSWKDRKEDFGNSLEKVADTLIEQIDNLSFIASEFSNFAKMPKAAATKTNIVDVIYSSLSLFENTDNSDISFEHGQNQVFVYADREQLTRVFINLLKNAIQSIPESRKGIIVIRLDVFENIISISVSDNGKGMSEDIQNKLFSPSFTTKSSGMGLGLYIAKNIIESFQGSITFKTEVNKGTDFIIELPVYKDVTL